MSILAQDKNDGFAVARLKLPGKDYFADVPDGTYNAKFIGVEGYRFFAYPKVCCWFEIESAAIEGPKMVARYFNVNTLIGTLPKSGRRRNPEFEVGAKSALAREIAQLFPGKFSPFKLPSRIPTVPDNLISIVVKKSIFDRDGDELVTEFRESRVKKILGWAEVKD